jgi:chitinase
MGPYAYSKDQWVSFDDAAMIRYKSNFIREMGLGGGMIWALDLDDFRNTCSCEPYPLLRTINRVLRGYPGPGPKCDINASSSKDSSKCHFGLYFTKHKLFVAYVRHIKHIDTNIS